MSERVMLDVPCRFERNNGRTTWFSMPGELLHDIAPHLASVCTFAVCRSPCAFDLCDNYIVVSLETGLRVRGLYPTKDEAIAAARKVLKGIGPKYAEWRINEERPEGE